ncbi:MAG: Epoxyqueuosine (oQ) reductase QueG [uncultured Thiotrichaceae bacterium]|uniref:Epoxyqueuosine reductase n=1 Tax=uncultured Thiotrichaceae bacterium TaxID=298394 RepID=A0A6S6TBC5_9GAMM|nr:MAG: Epoxyqueuosine (oQ) reductase QueG [uncultured Thiotrichaceae bacterium]
MPRETISNIDTPKLISKIHNWGKELGFQQLGFSGIDLSDAERNLHNWLAKGFHGDMEWMASHGTKRSRPKELIPDTYSIISVRMEYLPNEEFDPTLILNHPEMAYISRYALGRDYHKMMRNKLQKLAKHITQHIGDFGYRVFVDSAPVLEKPIAVKAGLGWVGKHTNILNREAGSWFFLGEIYLDLELPTSEPVEEHCGDCTACIDVCPTAAIIAPYKLDARRCISYLTIEHKGSIPKEFRTAIGNRIYGCDDCQLICPWNRFAKTTTEQDFQARHQLDQTHLLTLFAWNEETFLKNMEGSAIRRIGFERWQRNLAIALGNAPTSEAIFQALTDKLNSASELVTEHIHWSLLQHQKKSTTEK